MNASNTCPCCSSPLTHHFGNHREYWFCRHCWSEMPNLEVSPRLKHRQSTKIVNLSTVFNKPNRSVLAS